MSSLSVGKQISAKLDSAMQTRLKTQEVAVKMNSDDNVVSGEIRLLPWKPRSQPNEVVAIVDLHIVEQSTNVLPVFLLTDKNHPFFIFKMRSAIKD